MVATRRLKALTEQVEARLDLPDGRYLVALSGGADSACLAWLIARHRPIRSVHIHHGLPASDLMQAAAKAVAQFLDIPLEVSRVKLERFSEAIARTARYEALEAVRARDEWILTGHTSDDQAETVLANLLRGAGLDGLAGIPERRGPIARPLLGISRSETRELATLAGVPFVDDPANLDQGPVRNRIRAELIPHLEAEYNPGLRRHLVAAARAISELTYKGGAVGEPTSTGWRAPTGVLWAMGKSQATNVMRQAARDLGTGYGFDRAGAERVWAVVMGVTAATEVGGHIRVARSGPWIEIIPNAVEPG